MLRANPAPINCLSAVPSGEYMKLNNLLQACFIVALIVILAGCGGGGSGSSDSNSQIATANRVVSTVSVVDGNNQSAPIGTELANPLVALIKNSEGQVIAGQTINFKVVSGGGTVFAGVATSDANGFVRERWTLGLAFGTQQIEVRAVDSNGASVVFATFTANATAGPASRISAVNDRQGGGILSQPLPSQSTVLVTDSQGNPVSEVLVAFNANNGGEANPSSATTDTNGLASTVWTLGPLDKWSKQTMDATIFGTTYTTTFSEWPDVSPAPTANHPYDGKYTLTLAGKTNFDFTIDSGNVLFISYDNIGTINEANGTVIFRFMDSVSPANDIIMTGQLVVLSPTTTTGSGTITQVSSYSSFYKVGDSWTCNRQ